MKIEEIGKCPCCCAGKGVNSHVVNFYTSRLDNGDLVEIYIFGDDDFDLPSSNSLVTNVKFSDDRKSVIEVECPRCKENISVNIPIVKEQTEFFKALQSGSIPLRAVSQNTQQMQV